MSTTTKRDDPLLSFRFHAEIDGLLFAGFSDVSGLNVEIETERYQEGGVNNYVHILPKNAKYQNIVLKKGIAYSSAMWDWMKDVAGGIIKQRNGRIILMDYNGNEIWYWKFQNAYPVKWTGTDLSSTGDKPFIETMELAHTGIQMERSQYQPT